jgi:hypothetical protein
MCNVITELELKDSIISLVEAPVAKRRFSSKRFRLLRLHSAGLLIVGLYKAVPILPIICNNE